ncbi:MAG TPA: hypothetical protein VKS79_09695 [Gemmataceae bacterium]|nr:hypothetical protein [Gemmataceae bacterium]
MKITFASLLVLGLVAFTGCDKGTQGGPGATNPSNRNTISQDDDTFKLSVPTFSTSIKQGESKVVDIGIKRGKNFDEDVSLKFDNLPKGVSLDPAAPAIKHGDKDTKVTLKAANDAAVGDFTVRVIGHPTKGPDASNDMKLSVEKK